ncbi:MAG TPA: YqiJ family protein [Allosphingosinicella sp.]|nr:YqiJ family protein [Allosphingosinicella sp.]
MFDFILAPENLPFAVALALMLMIGVVEALGLGLGAVDLDAGVDVNGDFDMLAWLGVGKVPLLILIVVLLGLFGLSGIILQQIAAAVAGGPLSAWLAAPAALIAALPLTGGAARALARVLPQDETTAVSLESLIGKRATVTVGTARRGSPAQARVRDVHGQSHYVMVEPSADHQSVSAGQTMLLVRREDSVFIGLYEGEELAALDERTALGSN